MKTQKITITLLGFLLLLGINNYYSYSQLIVHNDGIELTVSSGTTVSIVGSFVNQTNVTDGIITNNDTIQVTGNWTNNVAGNNVFATVSGNVKFNGTAGQNINGNTDFHDITIANPTSVSVISGTQNVTGTLQSNSGTFNTGNLMTIISNPTNTGRVGKTLGTISGNMTVQRYISGAEDWRLLSSPVSGITFAQWNDDPTDGKDFMITGIPGTTYPNDFTGLYSYDETKVDHKDTGFVIPSHITNPILTGVGYFAYIWSFDLPATVDVFGPIHGGAIALPVSYSPGSGFDHDGWNLVANPYPSAIDWDQAGGWTKASLEDAIYIWNPAAADYASYVAGVGVNGGTKDIASSQAFWVHSSAAAPSLIVNENAKINVTPTFFQTPINSNILRLTLDGNGYATETVVRFKENATPQFDGNYDAFKMWSFWDYVPAIYSKADTIEVSINALPEIVLGVTVPLYVYIPANGSYSIDVSGVSDFSLSTDIYLEDKSTSTFTDLRSVSSYSFTGDVTDYDRFVLHFAPILQEIKHASCYGETDGIIIIKKSTGTWDYIWEDENSNVIQTSIGVSTADTLDNIGAGVYTVTISDGINFIVDSFQINQPAQIISQFTTNVDTAYLVTLPAFVQFNNTSSGANDYVWDFGDGTPQSNESNPNHGFYAEGIFKVVLSSINGVCSNNSEKYITILPTGIIDQVPFSEIFSMNYDRQGNKIMIFSNNPELIINNIELVNIIGQSILFQSFGQKSNTIQIDINNPLPKTIYFLKINTSLGMKTGKLLLGDRE